MMLLSNFMGTCRAWRVKTRPPFYPKLFDWHFQGVTFFPGSNPPNPRKFTPLERETERCYLSPDVVEPTKPYKNDTMKSYELHR